ncbi:MAG: NADH-quinone oxidoreductase subunit N [Chloroflexi bacterium]|nr:NADH-quinone oxidoreductase subunit N [Chloroflexota bacterium]
MSPSELFLLSPEISVALLGGVILLLDLAVKRKGYLAAAALVGLLVPAGFSVGLLIRVGSESTGQLTGVFDTLFIDRFAIYFKFLILAATALVIAASVDYRARLGRFQGEYYGLILFSASGMMLLAAGAELITLFVALELATLPLVALAAFLRDARSTESGLKFLVLSAVSSALLLYGMAFTFGVAGSTWLRDIGQVLSGASQETGAPFGSYALMLGIALMVAGFGFKIASVPFQMWVPDVYEGSPTPVTAYLSVASKAAGFAVLLRVFYVALGSADLRVEWGTLFAVLSVLSMSVGNLVAIAQSNIKRMLAYSTVAHAGYLLVGVAAVARAGPSDSLGPSGVLFYLATYTLTNLTAFFVIIAIVNKTGSEVIEDFAGMGRRAPWLALALAISMVSLIGVPPTGGFIGKVYIFSAAVRHDLAWLALAGVINSVVSVYYYMRVVRALYVLPSASQERVPSSLPLRWALGITAIGTVFLGLLPTHLLRFAQEAARILTS